MFPFVKVIVQDNYPEARPSRLLPPCARQITHSALPARGHLAVWSSAIRGGQPPAGERTVLEEVRVDPCGMCNDSYDNRMLPCAHAGEESFQMSESAYRWSPRRPCSQNKMHHLRNPDICQT